MRNQIPLVPGQPAFDVTVHIVLNYYDSRLDRAYAETGEDEADEKTTLESILSGQYSHPLRVVAFNTAEGWSRAAEVLVQQQDGQGSRARSIERTARFVPLRRAAQPGHSRN